MSILLDTHAAIWYALNSDRLSNVAKARIDAAFRDDHVYLSSISIVEVIYLVEKGRLPDVALDRLLTLLRAPDTRLAIVPLDLDVAEALRQIDRTSVPDMPDRIIAATARHLGLPLVTRVVRFIGAASRPSGKSRAPLLPPIHQSPLFPSPSRNA